MCGFASIIDQERPIRILTVLLQNETLPHALLFTGTEGVGKQTTAIALAMACNCQNVNSEHKPEIKKSRLKGHSRFEAQPAMVDSCGHCGSCKKIKSGNHPDIIQIRPSGPFIKIAQVRALGETLAMKPYEARTRVVIIQDAQTLNPAAGNALLKILEEPPEKTILILVATQTLDLLPTIVSRCQHIRFNPIARETLVNLLVGEHGLAPADAVAVAAMANGSFSRAVAMYTENWVNRRNWVLKTVQLLSSRPLGFALAFAERLSKDKDALAETFEMMKAWLRDLVMAKYYPEKIINQDMTQDIERISRNLNLNSLISRIGIIQATQNGIHANTNLRLTLEVMLMKLARYE